VQPSPSSDSARKARTSSSSSTTSTRAPAAAPARPERPLPPPPPPPGAPRGRQQDVDRRALARPRCRSAGPAGLLGDAVDLGEAEAGALAERLGREERLGGAGEHVGRHALPVSATVIRTKSPAGWSGSSSEPDHPVGEMVSVPPSGIASRALMARLRIAFSSWLASQNAVAGPRIEPGLDPPRRRSCGEAGAASRRSPR
jgi:hypothetical protein